MIIDYTIICIYLIVIVVIGFRCSTKLKTLKDFSMSNQKYGVFCLVATLSSSFIGGGFSTGNATKVMENGISNMVALMGFSLAMIALGKFVVPNIKPRDDVSSVGEIMKKTYGDGAGIITGFFGTLICAGILGAQISAIGYLFHVFLGISQLTGIIIGCTVVILYSTLGGMCSVVKIDSIQFVVMSIGMLLLVWFSVNAVGGMSNLVSHVPPTHLDVFNGHTIASFVSLALSLAVGEILAPPYVQRLLMGKSLQKTAKATVISGLMSIMFFVCTGLVGLSGILFFATENIDTNLVMQLMIQQVVPIGLRGIIIAGTISIVMSSADSFLNSASVSLVNDVVLEVTNKDFTQRQKLLLVRIVNLLIGCVAVIVAVLIPNILDVLMFSYGFWSPFVFMPLLGALLGKKAPPQSFYVSMICGGASFVIWGYIMHSPFGIEASVVGVIANVIAWCCYL